MENQGENKSPGNLAEADARTAGLLERAEIAEAFIGDTAALRELEGAGAAPDGESAKGAEPSAAAPPRENGASGAPPENPPGPASPEPAAEEPPPTAAEAERIERRIAVIEAELQRLGHARALVEAVIGEAPANAAPPADPQQAMAERLAAVEQRLSGRERREAASALIELEYQKQKTAIQNELARYPHWAGEANLFALAVLGLSEGLGVDVPVRTVAALVDKTFQPRRSPAAERARAEAVTRNTAATQGLLTSRPSAGPANPAPRTLDEAAEKAEEFLLRAGF
ncbi:MAG: hypothetical protein GMKNLPBB_00824 [Myxococcota bacterium]|nr:hypothetical protein [Myxococcota bacterium]